MKIRVADYIANKVAEAGVKTIFSVVGGGAMNLNDAFGHNKDLKVYYNHHEQACAMAAECYARVNNEMSGCVLTTGPGGINALNGVAGAYCDSIPMIVITGQVRWDSFSLSTGLPLRCMGDQEFNIVGAVQGMTKYAVILKDKNDVRYVVEKALYLANHGRKGPTWIDVPGDIQSATVETDDLVGYDYKDEIYPEISTETLDFVIEKLRSAKRPVIYGGSAVRISGAYDEFQKLINKIGAPVVTAWNALDDIETDHELFAGRPGNFGDRYGNFAVQNSDCILSLGCRLSIRQTGFNYASWAPKAFVMMVDVDEAELKKPTIHVEYPVHAELLEFVTALNKRLEDQERVCNVKSWINQCKAWMKAYPIVSDKFKNQTEIGNAYAIVDLLSRTAPENTVCVSSNGTACVVGGQVYFVKKGTRFLENSSMASMGYGLPAAIGACIANNKELTICLEGDGSIQMNIQELQTIVHHNLPIKIVIFNNDGYHSIRQSQSNFFKDRALCGVGPDSSDLSFPDMKKISNAYGIKFTRCLTNQEFDSYVHGSLFKDNCPEIIEVMVDHTYFQPKAGSKRLADGSMVSAPLEDLAPYLDREELEEIMKISSEK